MLARTVWALLFWVAVAAGGVTSSQACTSLRIKSTEGGIFYARTMEFPTSPQVTVAVFPRGTVMRGTLPDGKQEGATWTSKYGFVGMRDYAPPIVSDGMNEKGLVVGMLLFPGYAGYQPFDSALAVKTIANFEMANWLLSSFATVDEVCEGLKTMRVCEAPLPMPGGVSLPLHYVVHDAMGGCLVVEYMEGRLKVYDNPLGVMTNSPPFDWMLINLSNYVNLSATGVPKLDLNGFSIRPAGQGSGMLGLPGDFTPPSRFVRFVALTQSALPVSGPDAGVTLAMTLIDNADIPKGAVRQTTPNGDSYDVTIWSVVADTTRLRYYFRTYDNKNWSMVDVPRALSGAEGPKAIPVSFQPDYPDVTDTAKPAQ
jgi:choloylglycine hydrolase